MKKSKLLKSLGFASLAVFMGATALFAFAPLNNTSIAAGGLNVSANTENQTFDLGLRPDTDPVVYVTESGLEIKMSNASKFSETSTFTTNTGYSYTQNLTGFYYFTMGTFSGTIYTAKNTSEKFTVTNEPVNWIILGRGNGFQFSDTTPAGTSIKNENEKQEIGVANSLYLPIALESIPENEQDIPDNCFLVLSEKLLGQTYFNSSGTMNYSLYTGSSIGYFLKSSGGNFGNRYRFYGNVGTTGNGSQSWNTTNNTGGTLYNYINNLFTKNNSTGAIQGDNQLGFTQAQADMIVPQQLYTYFSNGEGYNYQETPSSDGGTYYTMFPLARKEASPSTFQNFCVEDYLSIENQRITTYIDSSQIAHWWLRSGNPTRSYCPYNVSVNGKYDNTCDVFYVFGVRPAFVLKIMD